MSTSLPVIDLTSGLPGINRPLDNTAMQAYMACPREYYFGMVLHRRGDGKRSPALAFGGVVHKILECHYKGMPEEMIELIAKAWWEKNGHDDPDDHRTFARAWLDYERYRKHWGLRPELEQGRTIGYPDEPMVEIATDSMGAGLIHPYAGKIDRIIELGDQIYVEDHKTTSRLDKNYFSSYELSQQMMGYTYLAQQLVPSLKIVGVRVNVIHILKDTTKFERQIFTWTREQMAEWIENTNAWMKRLNRDMEYWIEIYGDGDNPDQSMIPQPRLPWPIAHYGENGCSRKYGLCQYHRVCSVAAPFRHRALEELPVNPWNPLETED